MYTQKNSIMALDHSRFIGLENKFFPNKITQSPTSAPPLFYIGLIGQHQNLIFCYKGQLEDMILLGGSQFTHNL